MSPLVAVFMIGLRNGCKWHEVEINSAQKALTSNVVKMNTEIESMIFSIKGPRPGIFSIVFSIFLTTM